MARGRPRKNLSPAYIIKNDDLEELEKLPLNTFEDYAAYNKKARSLGIPVKVPPLELHKYVKCKITRLDNQGGNVLRIRKRDALIDFDATIQPGVTVELPERIIDFIESLVYPQYKQVTYPDGTSETVFSHNNPRFAVSMVR